MTFPALHSAGPGEMDLVHASLLDYLDAERSYRATQLAYRQALANYMLSLELLRQAVGTRELP